MLSIATLYFLIIVKVSNANNALQQQVISGKKSLFRHFLDDLNDLKSIVIVNESLPVLKTGDVMDLPIEELGLSYVGLKELEWKCFKNVPNLTLVYLNHNELTVINRCIFNGLNLQSLHLRSNKIQKIQANAFDGLRHLELLDISNNQIAEIDPDWCCGCVKLLVWTIRGNEIKEIPDGSFRNVKELTHLDLSRNKISAIKKNCFEELQKLSKLDLSANVITVIPRDVFKKTTSLNILILNINELDCSVLNAEFPESVLMIQMLGSNLFEHCPEAIKSFRSHSRRTLVY